MEINQLVEEAIDLPLFSLSFVSTIDAKEKEGEVEKLLRSAQQMAGDDFSRIFTVACLWWAIVTLNTSLYWAGQEQRFWPEAEEVFEQIRQNPDDWKFFQEIVEGDPLFS